MKASTERALYDIFMDTVFYNIAKDEPDAELTEYKFYKHDDMYFCDFTYQTPETSEIVSSEVISEKKFKKGKQ
jgi:hypothetical protein